MRHLFSVVALAGACAVGAGLSAGCAETKQGEIVLAFQTDMKVPEDVSVVALQVKVAGVVKFSQSYAVGPSGVKLPSTIALVDPTNKGVTVSVRLVGLTASKPRTLRDVVTTIPPKRSALLRLGIQYLCTDSASIKGAPMTTPDEAANVVESVCSADQTCIAGTCADARVDSASLPDYVAADVFGGGDETGGGTCFDVQGCFAGAISSPVDPACTIAAPADLSRTNVALRLPLGSDGVCDQTACYVVLDAETTSGWKSSGGRLQLPTAVCKKTLDVVVSARCAQKTEKIPTCGPWSSVTGNTETPDGGPLPPPPDGGMMRLPKARLFQAAMGASDLGPVALGGSSLFFAVAFGGNAQLKRCQIPDCMSLTDIGAGDAGPGGPIYDLAADGTHVVWSPFTGSMMDEAQVCPSGGPCTPKALFTPATVVGLAVAGGTAYGALDFNDAVELHSCTDLVNGCSSTSTIVVSRNPGAHDIVAANGQIYWFDSLGTTTELHACDPKACTPVLLKGNLAASTAHLAAQGPGLAWLELTDLDGGFRSDLTECAANMCTGRTFPDVDAFAFAPMGFVIARGGQLFFLDPGSGQTKLIDTPPGPVTSLATDGANVYASVADPQKSLAEVWRYPLP